MNEVKDAVEDELPFEGVLSALDVYNEKEGRFSLWKLIAERQTLRISVGI